MNAALQLDGDGEREPSSTQSSILNHIFCTFCRPQHFFRPRLPGLVAVRCESQIETEILLLVLTSRHELWIFFIHTNITSVKWDIVSVRSQPQQQLRAVSRLCADVMDAAAPGRSSRHHRHGDDGAGHLTSLSAADKAITGAQSRINWPPRYYRLSVGMPSIAAYAYSFHTSIPYHIHRDENVTVPLQSNKFLWKIFEILNVLTFLHKFIVTFYRLFPATYGLFRKQVFVAETQQRRTKRSVFGSDWSYLSIWRLVLCVGSPWPWSGSFSKKYWILLSRISRSLPSPGWSRGCWWLN